MRMCMGHWTELRQAINDRGLSHLVSQNGQEAAKRMANLSNGSTDPKDFDPLLAAHMAITSYYISHTGLDHINESDVCPVCHASENADGNNLAENWISGAADDVFAVAKSKGLVSEQ